MNELTPYGYAVFHACTADFVMVNLQRQCQSTQAPQAGSQTYQQRTQNIRSYVQQIMADTTLNKRQKKDYIHGRLMQGNNKGRMTFNSSSLKTL